MDAPVITRRPSALPMHHISRFSRSSVKCGTGASGGVYLGRDEVTGTIVAVKRRYERRSSGGAQARQQQQRDVDYTTTDDEGEDGLRVTASPNASVLRNTMRRSTVVVDEEALREAIGPQDETEDRIHALLYPHENIVDTLAVCSTSRHLVMPLMDADLRREIEGGNHELMNEDVSVWLLYDILVGIEHMHSHRVAHRDLKPQNVLLAKDEHRFPLGVRTVLCDFGSAHYATDTFIRDQSINQRGTLYYMPPEALLAKISAASQALPCDMWSFGCIVGELLTGTLLFPGSSQMNVLDNIVRRLGSTMGDWPRVVRHETLYDDLHDQISPHALDLLRGCLTLDAAQRITSQQALQHPFFATVASYYTQHQGGRLPAHGPPMSVYGLAPLLGLCSTKPLPNLSSITFVVIERGEDAGLAETSHNNTSNMNSTDNSIHLSALCRRDQLGAVSTIARSAGRWLDCSGEVTASNQRLFQRSLFSPSDAETSGYGPLNSMSTNHSQHGGAHVRSDDACKTLAFDSPGRTEHHYA